MVSQDFILFLVRKAVWEGRVFQVVKLNDHLDDRIPVDPRTVTFRAARLAKFSEHEGRQDVALVAAELQDVQGEYYTAHLNVEFDKLLTEFGQQFVFGEADLTPPAN